MTTGVLKKFRTAKGKKYRTGGNRIRGGAKRDRPVGWEIYTSYVEKRKKKYKDPGREWRAVQHKRVAQHLVMPAINRIDPEKLYIFVGLTRVSVYHVDAKRTDSVLILMGSLMTLRITNKYLDKVVGNSKTYVYQGNPTLKVERLSVDALEKLLLRLLNFRGLSYRARSLL